jgi:RNA polymerase sigma-70 factor (ECF subfamily)
MTRKEFNKCVDEYGDRVFGFALKNTRNDEDARDIVQEAFEKMWLKHGDVDREKARSYLFSTAYHCIIDHFRKVKKLNTVRDGEGLRDRGENMEGRIDDRQWIEEGLSRLNEQERTLILLRDYEGYNYEELCGLTGLNMSQVKVYLFRARKKFRQWLIDLEGMNKVI